MNIIEIIQQKKRGMALSSEQIKWWIDGVMDGSVADYQSSALLMAMTLNGLDDNETYALTMAQAQSGKMLNLDEFGDRTADKHSSGGVGDTTSLITLPIVVACGMIGAKTSGRGLGHTGGTLDKLESIKGVKVELSESEFLEQARKIGIVIGGQSKDICPADKILYALRDVTATVDCLGLIAASIMSKKLASGAKNIVLDVKCGVGAFMQTYEDAEKLARLMVGIGKKFGRNISALITGMNAPLSNYIGNALEVYGAVRTLKNKEKGSLYEVSILLAEQLLQNYGIKNAKEMAIKSVESGKAFEVFRKMIIAEGGDISYVDCEDKLLSAKVKVEIYAQKSGYINKIDSKSVANIVCALGGGRMKKTDVIDCSVGVIMHAREGDFVSKGQLVGVVYCANEQQRTIAETLTNNIIVADTKPATKQLILGEIR